MGLSCDPEIEFMVCRAQDDVEDIPSERSILGIHLDILCHPSDLRIKLGSLGLLGKPHTELLSSTVVTACKITAVLQEHL